jgi:hypothetical protein
LNLSPDQLEQIRQADPQFHTEMRRLHRALQIERLKLANLFESDAQAEDVRQGMSRMGQKMTQIHQRFTEHVLKIRPHLNTEQRSRFFEMVARRLRGQAGPGGSAGKGRHRGHCRGLGRFGPDGPGPAHRRYGPHPQRRGSGVRPFDQGRPIPRRPSGAEPRMAPESPTQPEAQGGDA